MGMNCLGDDDEGERKRKGDWRGGADDRKGLTAGNFRR